MGYWHTHIGVMDWHLVSQKTQMKREKKHYHYYKFLNVSTEEFSRMGDAPFTWQPVAVSIFYPSQHLSQDHILLRMASSQWLSKVMAGQDELLWKWAQPVAEQGGSDRLSHFCPSWDLFTWQYLFHGCNIQLDGSSYIILLLFFSPAPIGLNAPTNLLHPQLQLSVRLLRKPTQDQGTSDDTRERADRYVFCFHGKMEFCFFLHSLDSSTPEYEKYCTN